MQVTNASFKKYLFSNKVRFCLATRSAQCITQGFQTHLSQNFKHNSCHRRRGRERGQEELGGGGGGELGGGGRGGGSKLRIVLADTFPIL